MDGHGPFLVWPLQEMTRFDWTGLDAVVLFLSQD